jgi:beta-galactosidase/beta-glucuronidase
MNTPRNEYPRPQFVRNEWMNLNGEWDFSFDTACFDKKIIVPYVYQSKLSGINIQEAHETVWYRKEFVLPENMLGKRIILHFGAVDYSCQVWVNDIFIKEHIGGHISFEMDITHALKEDSNTIVLKVDDSPSDLEIPRGKQYWKDKSEGIFYTRSTGIWQTVWLEAVDEVHLEKVFITPDIDNMQVEFNYEISGNKPAMLRTEIYFEGKFITASTIETERNAGIYKLLLDQQILRNWNFQEELVWTPEHPRLFDVIFKVYVSGQEVDSVSSYFGMRKVSIENGRFLLNNREYYQKLLLDQGYWEDSLLTAPTDEDFVKDIKLAKSMGFNGVRKHQKIEDPRFLYHADRLGFLVWGEIAAAYVYSRKYVKRITYEWIDEILRDYNHPSIVVWTPLNESWGVFHIKDKKEQQSHSAAMVYLTKSIDQTRPVISNDGWEHTCTDLFTIHDYEWDREILKERYSSLENIFRFAPGGRPLLANGWEYKGQPILVTEFGGISYKKGDWSGWGYSNATSDEDFAQRYHDVVSPLLESPFVQGFCYTQITDVEQEINGLCTYDRQPKIPVETIRAINEGKWKK